MLKENYDKVIEGLFKIDTIKDGKIIDTYEEKNKIMNTARTAMARNMTGKVNVSSPINKIVLGNMGNATTILDPKDFISTRKSLFSEAHMKAQNVTDLGLTFDGVDTLTNNSGSSITLIHNNVFLLNKTDGTTKEFRKVDTLLIADTQSYTITEEQNIPVIQAQIEADLGLTFDGINTITNNTSLPIDLYNDRVYLVTLSDNTVMEFTKVGNENIVKEGGTYIVDTVDEPLIELQQGNTFSVEFDSTDFTYMDTPTLHETIILASDGTSKSQKITAVKSYVGTDVAAITSGVNINVITEGNKATYKFTIPQTQGNAEGGGVVAYTEAALYCDEQIFSMKTFPARTKDSSLEYIITWVITF